MPQIYMLIAMVSMIVIPGLVMLKYDKTMDGFLLGAGVGIVMGVFSGDLPLWTLVLLVIGVVSLLMGIDRGGGA